MSFILKRDSLGFGDVKFFIMAGLWLGLSYLPYFLMLSGVFGVLFGFAWQYIKKEKLFPFGPALILSFVFILCIKNSPELNDLISHLLIL